MNAITNSVFHYTNIDSCIDIIIKNKIFCSSVKSSLLNGNQDFLVNQYIVPAIKKINSEMSEKNISVLCKAFLPPLICTSYIFSTTLDSDNSFHWEKYATEDGCCIKIKRNALQASGRFMEDATVCYDDRLFNNEHIQTFLRHYIDKVNGTEKDIGREMNDETTAFVRAVAFSKYPNHDNDSEHRFLYSDMEQMNPEICEQRKDSNFSIDPLPLTISPEKDIENIYFKSETRKEKFLDQMAGDRNEWERKSFVLNSIL